MAGSAGPRSHAHQAASLLLPLAPFSPSRLDALLGSGLCSGDIVELVGPCGAGKTQLCHLLAAATAKQGHSVAYLDTSASFSPQRILDFAGAPAAGPASAAPSPARPIVADLPGTQVEAGDLSERGAADAASPAVAASRTLQAVRRFAVHDIRGAMRVVEALGTDLRAGEVGPPHWLPPPSPLLCTPRGHSPGYSPHPAPSARRRRPGAPTFASWCSTRSTRWAPLSWAAPATGEPTPGSFPGSWPSRT